MFTRTTILGNAVHRREVSTARLIGFFAALNLMALQWYWLLVPDVDGRKAVTAMIVFGGLLFLSFALVMQEKKKDKEHPDLDEES